ncbi:polyamine oxidase 6-like [Dendronephthya gigantea]|uniref:polyamine oxidase 6-like n=1 Tax=Dendronephthya gigantea TaxID=151771 RepID=UPI00106B4A66|nr:polyamine oxidase 6-like [Dendronephthya gigantea]
MFNVFCFCLVFFVIAYQSAGENTKVDVLILGAGISGISAANYFNNNGNKNFLVLEAQDYIGGRLKNRTVGNSTVSEGANWISFVEEGDKNPILKLADILKLTRYQSDYNDIAVRNAIDNDTNFKAVMAELDAAAEKVKKDKEKILLHHDLPLSSSLADAGWIADTPLKSAIEWFYYDYENAISAKLTSTRSFTQSNGGEIIDSVVTDRRGYALIVQYLAKNFTDKIRTGQAVRGINYTNNGVAVQTNDGSVFTAKYALCTFSTGVLADRKFVNFVPELPSWKRRAINNIPMGYFTFVIVRFEHVFWEDNEYLLDAGRIRAKFPVIFNRNKRGIQPGSNLFMFVATGDDAVRTEMQPQNTTVQEVMETLKGMYPDVNIPYPTDVVVSKWVTNEYVRGSYSNPVVGSTKADFQHLAGRVGNLFFSGEATSEKYFGFLQGGYVTGLAQAKAILSCLHDKECAS